uniref:Uncharacterized protein n=1 Tax=Anguilla anguilla TaxID=7936 RepID=A0A0E9QRI9_ANGAN
MPRFFFLQALENPFVLSISVFVILHFKRPAGLFSQMLLVLYDPPWKPVIF